MPFSSDETTSVPETITYRTGQSVARFADATARTAAIAAPVLNQLTMLDSRPGIVQYWTGSAWADATGGALAASAVTFTPTGTVAATNVQAAIAEVAAEAGGGATETGWSVTAGYTVDSVLNPQNTTVNEIANVLGSLIDALKRKGILGP